MIYTPAEKPPTHAVHRDVHRRTGPHYPYQNTRPRESRDQDFLARGPSSRD